MIRPLTVLCALLVLAACSRSSDQPKDIPPPASAPPPAEPAPSPQPIGFEGDFNALGTEPFWAVEVRTSGLKLSRPGVADVVTANPGPKVEGAKAVWAGEGLVLTLKQGQCSDGMSDRTYAYAAQVMLAGTTMKGCAARPGSLSPPP